jgi:predicted small metal-binding protein
VYKFSCTDLGQNCDYKTSGESRVEVMQAAMLHAATRHGEITAKFSEEQSIAFLKALEAAVPRNSDALLLLDLDAVLVPA